jgi:hypothetical protein
MNKHIRELFEIHTAPHFAAFFANGGNLDLSKNKFNEYANPVLEDHWQTFQEAVELAVNECAKIVEGGFPAGGTAISGAIKQHFGIDE